MLVAAGSNIHATDNLGMTPLHWSASYGHVELSEMLIRAGANVHFTDSEGKTPLDLAKDKGHGAVSALLLQESEPLTKSAAQGGAMCSTKRKTMEPNERPPNSESSLETQTRARITPK